MNFRLSALALLTVLLSLPYACGQTSVASYLENIDRALTTVALSSSSSVVGLGIPLTLSAVVSYPRSGQTTGNVTFTVENGSTAIATSTVPINLMGEASWSPALPSGTFTIFAVYSGDSNLLGSTSPAISQYRPRPPGFHALGLADLRIPGPDGGYADQGYGHQWLPWLDHIQLCLAVLHD